MKAAKVTESAKRSQSMICIAKTDPKPDCLFAYTGHPFDKEVGLQSNEIRHFDPTVGRWLDWAVRAVPGTQYETIDALRRT
jgi:RHS repeat-associated protein